MRSKNSKTGTSPAGTETSPRSDAPAGGDNLARAIHGVRLLRADGVLPVRITVGDVSLELAYPAPGADGGRAGAGGGSAPKSLAEDYLGQAAARELDRTGPPAGGGDRDPDDEDEPAVVR